MGYGGWIGVELATLSPARLSRLVLVGAAGLLPAQGRIHDQFLVSHLDYARAYFADPARYAAVFGAEPDLDVLERHEISREMTTRVAWKPYMHNRRLVHLLPELRIPTLLVWGERDRVVPPECGEQYRKLLPDARLEVVPGCGHAVDLERPQALAELIRKSR
jgi:pimeloyl-ACP methyl ester carboxylesterase